MAFAAFRRTLPWWLLTVVVGGLGLISCDPDYTPRPRGWNRIDLPRPAYQPLPPGLHPYEFVYSKHARILRDSSAFAVGRPDWINVDYPRFGGTLQLTYYDLRRTDQTLEKLIADARKLTSKHEVKASGIREQVLTTEGGLTADVFDLSGAVPSPFQFYVTDSVRHFLRAALYFRTAESSDSLAPVIQFIRADAVRMLNTLEFAGRKRREGAVAVPPTKPQRAPVGAAFAPPAA